MIQRPNKIQIIHTTIHKLVRRGAFQRVSNMLLKYHAADIAEFFRNLRFQDRKICLDLVDDLNKRAEVVSELDEEIKIQLLESMTINTLVDLLSHMSSDDAADSLSCLPERITKSVLGKMEREDGKEVEDLMKFDEETAGGIMIPDFLALEENTTAKEAILKLQDAEKIEMVFYIYVINSYANLVGVLSLRQLVTVPGNTLISQMMVKDILYVHTDADQEEVASLIKKYNILALPVVNNDKKLVGIITVDDIIDVIQDEATEDMLKMAGAGEDLLASPSVFTSTKIRMPWLFASWMGGIIAYMIITHYEHALSKVVVLAAFIPIIMGMGGNVGTQSSTLTVRGLATGQVSVTRFWSMVFKEFAVGLSLGIIYGILLGLVTGFQYSELPALGLIVGIAICASMTIATTVGTFIPLLFAKVNIDPAIATGPFVTTAIDIIGIVIYFGVATMFFEF